MWKILFWLGIAYIAYVELGYPLLLYVMAKIKSRPKRPASDYLPSVTILIAAYNEEGVIGQKLENTLSQEYPLELIQIIVASDCSTDRTDQIVQQFAERGVLLSRNARHCGKVSALRTAESSISGQVVVFTDADAILQPQAIRNLVRHFTDPKVGAVSGREIRPRDSSQHKGKGEGLFNRIETQVKLLESKIGNQVLLHGGIFALRRNLMPFVPDHLTHDSVVPAKLTLQGYKILYEPQAVSVESYDLDTQQDWQRRIRTVMQAFQSYLYVKEALNPWRTGFYALQIWSHRMLRWFIAPVMALVLISNFLLLGGSSLYKITILIQAIYFFCVGIGFWLDRVGKHSAIFYFPFYFLYIHLAAFCAVTLSWKGQRYTTWQPSQRQVVKM